jgi:hypothetical protein
VSRLYRFDLKVHSPQLPLREDVLFATAARYWEFDAWDVEPDGRYWGTGQGSFGGHEESFAADLGAALREALGPGTIIEVTARDLDSAPSTSYHFGPGSPRPALI